MPVPTIQFDSYSIVAVGSFNPSIFQPQWFSAFELISAEEANNATIGIIHKEIAVFRTEWFALQVTTDQFSVQTEDPSMARPLRDLVLGTFKTLEHTPVTKFGLNRMQHFDVDVPSKIDGLYHTGVLWDAVMQTPHIETLVIQGLKDEAAKSRVQVKLEPSNKVEGGTFLHINDHYEIGDVTPPETPMDRFLCILNDSFDDFLKYCDKLLAHWVSILDKASE